MKKMKFIFMMIFFIVICWQPVVAHAVEIETEGGNTVGSGGGEGSGMRINTTSAKWVVVGPTKGSPATLNDLRKNEKIKEGYAVAYLSCTAFVGNPAKTSNINTNTIPKLRQILSTNGSTVTYIDIFGVTQTMSLGESNIKSSLGSWKGSNGIVYVGTKQNNVWASWKNQAYSALINDSLNPKFKKWTWLTDITWTNDAVKPFGEIGIWSALLNGINNSGSYSGLSKPVPKVITSNEGSAIYGKPSIKNSDILLNVKVTKNVVNKSKTSIPSNTEFTFYVELIGNDGDSGKFVKNDAFGTSSLVQSKYPFTIKDTESKIIYLPKVGTYRITEKASTVKGMTASTTYTNSGKITVSNSARNASLTITNTYGDKAIPTTIPVNVTSLVPQDAPAPANQSHPCIWQNPPDEKIETKITLIYFNVTRYSDVGGGNETLLDKRNMTPEQLFNSTEVKNLNYDYVSQLQEHAVSLNVTATQAVVEKHTYYTITPGWFDTTFDRFLHGSGSGSADGWMHSNDGSYSYLSCSNTDEDHEHTGSCYGTGYYSCTHSKPCLHVVWKRTTIANQWKKNIEYRIVDTQTSTVEPNYQRIRPTLQYSYFKPLNLATEEPISDSLMNTLGFSPISSDLLSASLNIGDSATKNGQLLGVNTNIPMKFSLTFDNDQFGIPNHIAYLDDHHPREGEYAYETQYYWNGRMKFSSSNKAVTSPATSLEFNGVEKIGNEYFDYSSEDGFYGGNFQYRSVKVGQYALGCDVVGRPYWDAEFDMGLRYRYGIKWNVIATTGELTEPSITIPWSIKHSVPAKSTQQSDWSDMDLYYGESYVDDVWTNEITRHIIQPILYGEINIKTVGGFR